MQFVSAYQIDDREWQNAIKMKSIPPPHIKREAGDTKAFPPLDKFGVGLPDGPRRCMAG